MAPSTGKRTTVAEADAAHERYVKPYVSSEDKNKVVEIDLDSGDFEIGNDDEDMHDRLKARRPFGRFLLMGADGGAAGSFGFTSLTGTKS